MGIGKSKSEEPRRAKMDLSDFAVRVDKVNVKGVQRTYDDYVERASKKMFVARNFKELLEAVGETREALMELGVFKSLTAVVDTSKGAGATPNYGYEVTFQGEELSRITGSVGTEIAPHEGCFAVELSTPNLLGRGERVTLNGSYSNLKTSDLMLKFLKPYYHTSWGDYKPELSFAVIRHASLFDWSKFKTEQTGVSLEGNLLFPDKVVHSLRYDVHLRDTIPLTKNTPFFVREHCGPKLANVLSYSITLDTRDSNTFPTDGSRFKSSHELINSSFKRPGYLKNDFHAEVNCPLFLGTSLQFVGRLGNIVDVGKSGEKVAISDAFFLGGAQTLRGFYTAGAGEHKEGAAVGSNCYWLGAVHLWSPLPFTKPDSGFASLFRTQVFCNFGQAGEFTADFLRCSVGAGIAFKLGDRARIEFNYCHPIRHGKSDFKKAFQFGIGYDFT